MIYLTGDTHGSIDVQKVLTFNKGVEGDYLIILGDFGLTWYINGDQNYTKQERILTTINKKPFTTLFIDGNHENFTTLNMIPKIEKFGGVVGVLRNNIFHLKRNQVYTIDNKKFYVHGGGLSVDKDHRIEGVSWWREELPSVLEMNLAFDFMNLKTVDYILTHEAPTSFIPRILGRKDKRLPESQKFDSPLARLFESIYEISIFKHWYCGHYHQDITIDNLTVLFNDIIELE